MRIAMRPHAVLLLGLGLAVLVLGGCDSNRRTDLDILPSWEKARAALETALTTWKNGQKMERIKEERYSVEVIDRVWKAGGKLNSFTITPLEDKTGPRWFAVELTMQDAKKLQVNYAVVGIDPLWVYREEDYNQAMGMGNK
jgi:hypothetical protein